MIGPDDPRHGTTNGYQLGCHEVCCRAAHTAAMRRYRKQRYIAGRTRIDPTGTQRRIRALMRMGWRGDDLADAAGWHNRSVARDILRNKYVERRTAARIAAVYDRLAMRPGPSGKTARHAERAGWPPPLAWDDDTIDDPTVAPWQPEPTTATGKVARRRAALIEDVDFLVSAGVVPATICERLHRAPGALARALDRAGRHDLARPFYRLDNDEDAARATESVAA